MNRPSQGISSASQIGEVGEIRQQIQILENRQGELHALIDSLTARLSPVLRDRMKGDAEEDKEDPQLDTMLGNKLFNVRRQAEYSIHSLNRALSDLAL